MRIPGIIVRIADGLKVVVRHDQPLRDNGRIILHLINDDCSPMLNEGGNPRVRIINEMEYYNEMQASTIIGYMD